MRVIILTVGKTKSQELASLTQDFQKRVKKFQLKTIEVKAYGDDIEKEQNEILSKLKEVNGSVTPYLCTEWGKQYTSKKFSNLIKGHYEKSEDIVFIIGGASGFTENFREQFKRQFSLSEMTFPHEMVKVMLMEQIYRAQAIMDNHPYSK